MATYGEYHDVESTWDPLYREVLVPQQSVEYPEYNRQCLGGADYQFKIPRMDDLMSRESEMLGKAFPLRVSPHEAQVHCRVSLLNITLSLTILSPSASEEPTVMHTYLVAVIKQSPPADDIVLTCDVQRDRAYNRFYPFCSFIYADRMKNPENVLSIDVYAQNCLPQISTRAFRWKVDCSNTDITKNLAVSPIFPADPDGFDISIRLFLRGGQRVAAEFRFCNEIDKRSSCDPRFLITLTLINPKDRQLNIVHLFNFLEWFQPEEWSAPEFQRRFSTIREIADVDQVLPLLINKKLMVKVQLNRIRAPLNNL